jgi:hypothetical protein
LSGIEGLEEMDVRDIELVTMMLGLYDMGEVLGGLVEVREGKDGFLVCIERHGEVSYLHIEPRTRVLKGYEAHASGRKLREIRFSSFRTVNGFDRPGSIKYKDNENGFEIRISVRDEVINDVIDLELFELPPGWRERLTN